MVVGLSQAAQPWSESSYWACKLLSTHAMGSVVSILCQQIVRFGVLEVTALWIQWCTLSSMNISVEKVQIHLESWLGASVDSCREISEPCVLWYYLSDGESTSCSHFSHLFFWYNWCVNSSLYITFSPWSHVCSVLWCSSVCNSLSSHLGGVWWLSPPHRLGVSACEPVFQPRESTSGSFSWSRDGVNVMSVKKDDQLLTFLHQDHTVVAPSWVGAGGVWSSSSSSEAGVHLSGGICRSRATVSNYVYIAEQTCSECWWMNQTAELCDLEMWLTHHFSN